VEFARDLRKLRESAGSPSYDTMARNAHSNKTSLSNADNGEVLPSRGVTQAYVTACGGNPVEWEERRQAVAVEISASKCRGRRTRRSSPRPVGERQSLPSPLDLVTVADFRAQLRKVHVWAGSTSYRELAAQATEADLPLARSTISDMLSTSGSTMPTSPNLLAFLTVCGVPVNSRGEWLQIREEIIKSPGRRARRSGRPSHVVRPKPEVRVWEQALQALPYEGVVRLRKQLAEPGDIEQSQELEPVVAIASEIIDRLNVGRTPAGVAGNQINFLQERERWSWTSDPPVAIKILIVGVVVLTVLLVFYIVSAWMGLVPMVLPE